MGKRKAKRRSNSVLKTTSYYSRYQVKFARRRAGTCAHRLCFSRSEALATRPMASLRVAASRATTPSRARAHGCTHELHSCHPARASRARARGVARAQGQTTRERSRAAENPSRPIAGCAWTPRRGRRRLVRGEARDAYTAHTNLCLFRACVSRVQVKPTTRRVKA